MSIRSRLSTRTTAAALILIISMMMVSGCVQSADKSAPPDMGLDLAPGQSLGIASVPNFRDVGGYTTVDGAVVRRGLAYRSNEPHPVSVDDLRKIAALGLVNDFDLRTAAEISGAPDQLPSGVKWVALNVLADAEQSGPALLEKLMRNPKEANVALGGGKVEAMFDGSYRDFVSLPSANKAYRELFVSLGTQSQLPALFHCTTGKDRTGWAAAALLTLLGVPKDKVMEDFLRSNDYILPRYKHTIDAFVAAGGEQAIPQAIFGVKPEYLSASFDELQKRHGTIENYFADGLGIDAASQQALRDLYLVKK